VTVTAGPGGTANASINNGSYDPDAGDTITVVQTPPGPYPVGTTTVTLTVTDNHGASNSCQSVVTVIGGADLSISNAASLTTAKSAQTTTTNNHNPPPPPSQNVTYTIKVKNLGPQSATGVVITDPLPVGTVFVSATVSQGTFTAPPVGTGGVVTANINSIANGATVTLTVVVKVTGKNQSSVTNTVSVSATTADPHTANNIATVKTSLQSGDGHGK
jgi:uncharacterized repeat protein (TIGR01451 family)